MLNPVTETKVVIIGAGPAGMAASIHLSKAGIRHLILEKSTFPRDKVCGDALSGKVLQFLKDTDERWLQELAADSNDFLGSYGVRFVAPGGRELDIPFKKDLSSLPIAPGFLATRTHFDHWLAKKADPNLAELISGAEVIKIKRIDSGLAITYAVSEKTCTIHTKLVIGADGERSVVKKHLQPNGLIKERDHYCAGLRRYYQGVTGFHEKNFIELHFLPELLPGYLWIFPMSGGRANVGVGMLSSVISKKRINLRKLMDQMIEDHPTLKKRFRDAIPMEETKGWGLPLGSKKRKISGDNFILTGDAGSLIDPFTGEGIGNALISGRTAAHVATAAIGENRYDKSRLSEYDHEVYRQLWDELKLSRTLQRLTRYGWLFDFVVEKASKNRLLQETITGMFEDIGLRSRLSNPGFYLRLLFGKSKGV